MPERLVKKEQLEMALKIISITPREIVEDIYLKNAKLGKLEIIENKIKFPLEKAFECLEKGAYKFNFLRKIEHCDIRGIEINGLSAISKICSSAECDELLRYEEYGKTWAATKEELE